MQMLPSGDGVSAQAPVTIKLLSPRAEHKPPLSSCCISELRLDFSQPAHSPPVARQGSGSSSQQAARLLGMLSGRSSSFPAPSSPSRGNWAAHSPVPDQPQPKANGPSHPAVPLSLIRVLFVCQAKGGVLTLSALWAGLCSSPCLHRKRVRAHHAPETAPSSCLRSRHLF